MPQVRDVTSVGASATVANIMSGSPFERVGGGGASVRVYSVQATGNLGDIQLTLMLGSDIVIQDAGLGVDAAGAKVPDNQVAEGLALPGDQITVKLFNTTAGAIVVNTIVDIQNG